MDVRVGNHVKEELRLIDINLLNIERARFYSRLICDDYRSDMQMVADYFDEHAHTLNLVIFNESISNLVGVKLEHPSLNLEAELEIKLEHDIIPRTAERILSLDPFRNLFDISENASVPTVVHWRLCSHPLAYQNPVEFNPDGSVKHLEMIFNF
ncbi:unnamed protein product [Ambrosiozyma monospora]|uniref:Unnamed protein product n=1 Tax=Ambrosiozyma monospora TaxID=43982 RepID=A0ACB5TUA3_AMBMO|nr:unnamed protein product [Ambrosiozyma monospora]